MKKKFVNISRAYYEKKKWQISVPGSTANLGPGFDSIGLGLSLYLKLDVSLQDSWEIIHLDDNGPSEFELEQHLLYVIAKKRLLINMVRSFLLAVLHCRVNFH